MEQARVAARAQHERDRNLELLAQPRERDRQRAAAVLENAQAARRRLGLQQPPQHRARDAVLDSRGRIVEFALGKDTAAAVSLRDFEEPTPELLAKPREGRECPEHSRIEIPRISKTPIHLAHTNSNV